MGGHTGWTTDALDAAGVCSAANASQGVHLGKCVVCHERVVYHAFEYPQMKNLQGSSVSQEKGVTAALYGVSRELVRSLSCIPP